MHNRIYQVLMVLFIGILGTFSLNAQTYTVSPYTRFGLGEFAESGFAQNRGMGGVGLAMNRHNQLNFINPASYVNQDTTSFIFDVGLNAIFKEYSQVNGSWTDTRQYGSGIVDHVAFGFPVTKWWNAAVGIMPYTNVGYNIKIVNIDEDIDVDYNYLGSGGLNKLTIGNGFQILDNLSIGVNANYIFGRLQHETDVNFPADAAIIDIYKLRQYTVSGFTFTLGANYQQKLGEKLNVSFGGIVDNETNLNYDYQVGDYLRNLDGITLDPISADTSSSSFKYPLRCGAGIAIQIPNKFIASLDYYMQDWSNTYFVYEEAYFGKMTSIKAGIEYIPEYNSPRYYFKRIAYRLGARYDESEFFYNKIDANQTDETLTKYGITFGLGIPTRGYTTLNVAVELGKMGSGNKNLVDENYGMFTFSLSLYDFWFMKRKYD